MTRRRVAVVGGGLAGLSAAVRCADAGHHVTLLEARSRLGGAASSFQRGELTVDTGQHVLLRCYRAYLAFLARLQVADAIAFQSRFTVPVARPGKLMFTLRRGGLPAPAHLLPVLLGHRALSLAERARVARTASVLRRLDPDDPALDAVSFGEWLAGRGESDRATAGLWGLLTVAALNCRPDAASLALAARVFRTGVLDATDAPDIGLPRMPLAALHDEAATAALEAAGATVRLRSKATAIRSQAGTVAVDTATDTIEADAVVVAVPHQSASSLLRGWDLPGDHDWPKLSSSPIINIHVIYDRRVMEHDLVAALDSPVQWVFDRTAIAGAGSGQYLAVSLSAADDCLETRTEHLRAEFLPALEAIFPAARQARVRDFFVTREPRATFRQAPGSRRFRPQQRTPDPGVVLAGAWVDTGWPDTMEGAVRSGHRAAELITDRVDRVAGRPARGVEVDA